MSTTIIVEIVVVVQVLVVGIVNPRISSPFLGFLGFL